MNSRSVLRMWAPIALVVLIVAGGVLYGVTRRSGTSKQSAARPTPTSIAAPTSLPVPTLPSKPGPLKGHGSTAAVSKRAATITRIHWTTTRPRLTQGEVRRLTTRVSDTDRPHEKLSRLNVVRTTAGSMLRPSLAHTAPRAAPLMSVTHDVIPEDATAGDPGSAREPTTAVDGNTIFQAGNWYADRSTDGGQSWTYFDPFKVFGSDFCCDQVVLYDSRHDLFFWLLQFAPDNAPMYLKLAVSTASSAFDKACLYKFDASWFGLPASGNIDYNDLAVSANYLYIASNVYANDQDSGRGGVLRLPIAQLASCVRSPSGLHFTDPGVMNIKPVQGADNVMYFGTNYIRSHQLGAWFRVYDWPENASSYRWRDRQVTSFNYEEPGVGRCGSADGVVTNWCERTQGKTQGAVIAGNTLIFAFNTAQLGASRPFPYVRMVYFDRTTFAYKTSLDLYNSTFAIQYPSMAVNSRNELGGIFAWGGGTGSNHYYPGIGSFVFGPGGAGSVVSYNIPGHGNACRDSEDHTYRWGDYLTARLHPPDNLTWEGAGFVYSGDCGAGGHAIEHEFLFGRPGDMGSA